MFYDSSDISSIDASVKNLTARIHSVAVITKAHSLTNTGNSHLIVPPTPSIYLLLTRLPSLLQPFDLHTVFTKMIVHTDLSLSTFSITFLSLFLF